MRVDGQSVSLDQPPKLSHRRKHKIEVVVDRAIVRRSTRSRLADSIESALDLGKGVVHIARVGDEASEPSWPVDRYSQHRVCDRCGRSFDELAPHHFSFNSPLGWCPICQGLGIQQGANPAVLVPDGRLSLRQGAVAVWPDFADVPALRPDDRGVCQAERIDLDTPFDDLDGRSRRSSSTARGDVVHVESNGTPATRWSKVSGQGIIVGENREQDAVAAGGFSFQYKGLFPAIEEAGRVSFVYRFKLQGMVDDVPCAAAWERGSATTRRPSGSKVSRSTRSPAGR